MSEKREQGSPPANPYMEVETAWARFASYPGSDDAKKMVFAELEKA